MAAPGLLRRAGRLLLLIGLGFLVAVLLAIAALRWVNPPTSAFMLEARLHALLDGEHGYRTEYQWVDLESISPQAAVAVIAAEDQQFPFHMGFDFQSIREAVRTNARRHHARGASTISQQVAKNLFLWSGGGYFRKGLEACLTLLIEWIWPKERILEMYLNIAQFGHGVYGVQAAAQRFFHSNARRLDRSEAALLAAVLPSPERLKAQAPTPYVEARRDWILGQMSELGGPRYLDALDSAAHRTP
ncbi:MAG TPA: monofunctional biosynthetic peptidoglycan transglycosylase [Steroidobacteraceae bacterium]